MREISINSGIQDHHFCDCQILKHFVKILQVKGLVKKLERYQSMSLKFSQEQVAFTISSLLSVSTCHCNSRLILSFKVFIKFIQIALIPSQVPLILDISRLNHVKSGIFAGHQHAPKRIVAFRGDCPCPSGKVEVKLSNSASVFHSSQGQVNG